MQTIRVLIADDHAILRSGLKMLINAQVDMEVVSEAPDGDRAVQAARETQPHVALIDLTMPGSGGMGALEEIARCCPDTRVLILSMHDEPAYLRSVLAAGASGYVLKRAVDTELLAAIRAVHRGGVFVDPSLAHVFVRDVLDKAPHDRLGQRGFEVGRDGFGEGGVGIAGDQLDRPVVGSLSPSFGRHHALRSILNMVP